MVFATDAGCGFEGGDEERNGPVVINSDFFDSAPCGSTFELCGDTYACICTPPPKVWHRPGVEPRCESSTPPPGYIVPLSCDAPEATDGGPRRCEGQVVGGYEAPVTDCVATNLRSAHGDFTRFRLIAKSAGGAVVASLQADIPSYEGLPGSVPYFKIARAEGSAGSPGSAAILRKGNDGAAQGYVDFDLTSFDRGSHGADDSTAVPHGCLSARFDPPDAGPDASSAYLWLSF